MTGRPALKVERVAMAELAIDPENARAHPAKNLEAIRSSLQRFGQQRPIVVREDGRIIAGNGTFTAAAELGWQAIEVLRFGGSAEEARAYALADNRTGELAAWDPDTLALQLEELATAGWDMLALGFEPMAPPDSEAWQQALAGAALERGEVQQLTFTMSDQEAEKVRAAIGQMLEEPAADDAGPNAKGAALAAICGEWLDRELA